MSDRDIELPEPEKKFEPDPRWPLVQITGGPHAKNLSMKVDGKEVPRVTHVEMTLDVNDVVRVKTFQMMQAMVEVSSVPEDGGFIASIEDRHYVDLGEIKALDHEKTQIIEGRGSTRKQALLDAIEKFPEDE